MSFDSAPQQEHSPRENALILINELIGILNEERQKNSDEGDAATYAYKFQSGLLHIKELIENGDSELSDEDKKNLDKMITEAFTWVGMSDHRHAEYETYVACKVISNLVVDYLEEVADLYGVNVTRPAIKTKE